MTLSAVSAAKLAKAGDFLLMAELAMDFDAFDVAVSLCATAAICASDVLIVEAGGATPRNDNHDAAVTVLRKLVDNRAAQQLAAALKNKSKSQYWAARCGKVDAEDALKSATRLVDKAKGLTQ